MSCWFFFSCLTPVAPFIGFGRDKKNWIDWVTLKTYQPKHAISDRSICIDCKNLSNQIFTLYSEMQNCASHVPINRRIKVFFCILSGIWSDMKIMEMWTEFKDKNNKWLPLAQPLLGNNTISARTQVGKNRESLATLPWQTSVLLLMFSTYIRQSISAPYPDPPLLLDPRTNCDLVFSAGAALSLLLSRSRLML